MSECIKISKRQLFQPLQLLYVLLQLYLPIQARQQNQLNRLAALLASNTLKNNYIQLAINQLTKSTVTASMPA